MRTVPIMEKASKGQSIPSMRRCGSNVPDRHGSVPGSLMSVPVSDASSRLRYRWTNLLRPRSSVIAAPARP